MSVTKPTQTSSSATPESRTGAEPRQNTPESVFDLARSVDPEAIGPEIYSLIEELYPICRSITGNGVRETLARIHRKIPLQVHEVPTGTRVFDWTIPREWNIRDAYIRNSKGERLVDFRKCNLHVVNYSVPVNEKLTLEDLKDRLFTLPNQPKWIPYRTSYYSETWGFCLAHEELEALEKQDKKDAKEGHADPLYEVHVDSTLENGSLTYGEYFLEGDSEDEILISCHICHPSLCNDNLSGVTVATYLAKILTDAPRKFSYRFLFIPGTIGSITWLSRNEKAAQRIRHGLVLACLGDKGGISYKRSRQGNAEVDRAVVNLLQHSGQKAPNQTAPNEKASHEKEPLIRDFSPYGYDERQYCSPGFNLAVGCLSRTPHGEFPEYHSSGDNLKFVEPNSLGDSLKKCLQIFGTLEENGTYLNQNPKCEPQLGKRGLYRNMGGYPNAAEREMAMLWVLNLSDGSNSLLDIADRADLPFEAVRVAARDLEAHGLLAQAEPSDQSENRDDSEGSPA